MALDRSISAIGIRSKITGTDYVADGREHIFSTFIRHLDNRSNPANFGIPITLSNGNIHEEYSEIAKCIADLI